jgi:hypothetical protein
MFRTAKATKCKPIRLSETLIFTEQRSRFYCYFLKKAQKEVYKTIWFYEIYSLDNLTLNSSKFSMLIYCDSAQSRFYCYFLTNPHKEDHETIWSYKIYSLNNLALQVKHVLYVNLLQFRTHVRHYIPKCTKIYPEINNDSVCTIEFTAKLSS